MFLFRSYGFVIANPDRLADKKAVKTAILIFLCALTAYGFTITDFPPKPLLTPKASGQAVARMSLSGIPTNTVVFAGPTNWTSYTWQQSTNQGKTWAWLADGNPATVAAMGSCVLVRAKAYPPAVPLTWNPPPIEPEHYMVFGETNGVNVQLAIAYETNADVVVNPNIWKFTVRAAYVDQDPPISPPSNICTYTQNSLTIKVK